MERLTEKQGSGYKPKANKTPQQIIQKLANFENMYDDLLYKKETIVNKMIKLKQDDKVKTATYSQLIATKLQLEAMINKFNIYFNLLT